MSQVQLPSLWRSVEVKAIADLVGGGTPSRKAPWYFEGTIPWLTGYDLPEDRVVSIYEARECITEKAIDESATTLVPEKTVLLTTRVTVGKVAVAENPLCFSQDVTGIIIRDTSLIDPYYLAHCLLANQEQLLSFNRGTTITGIIRRDVARLKIPLPPLPEQRHIVDILRQADELRQLRREANETAQELLPALFYEMFGDPVSNPKGWEIVKLKEVCTRITDGTHQPPPFVQEGIPFLFVSNIINGKIDFNTEKFITLETYTILMRRCPVEPGDILYSTVGSYGVAVIVDTDQPFAFQRHIAHIKPDSTKIDPLFLRSMMNTPYVKFQADRRARGIAQKTVNLGEIEQFEIILPPLSTQREWQQRVESVEATLEIQTSSKKYIDHLFEALIARGFTGKLTGQWREYNQKKLAQAAIERDQLLGQVRPIAPTVKLRPELTPSPQEQRSYLLSELSQGQRELLATINGIENYFVPDDLVDEYDLDPEVVQRGLHLLTELGLVRAVSLPARAADERSTVYIPAYRALRPTDDVRLDDLNWLEAPSP